MNKKPLSKIFSKTASKPASKSAKQKKIKQQTDETIASQEDERNQHVKEVIDLAKKYGFGAMVFHEKTVQNYTQNIISQILAQIKEKKLSQADVLFMLSTIYAEMYLHFKTEFIQNSMMNQQQIKSNNDNAYI